MYCLTWGGRRGCRDRLSPVRACAYVVRTCMCTSYLIQAPRSNWVMDPSFKARPKPKSHKEVTKHAPSAPLRLISAPLAPIWPRWPLDWRGRGRRAGAAPACRLRQAAKACVVCGLRAAGGRRPQRPGRDQARYMRRRICAPGGLVPCFVRRPAAAAGGRRGRLPTCAGCGPAPAQLQRRARPEAEAAEGEALVTKGERQRAKIKRSRARSSRHT
jgi:hypothetical protein